ncbi:MAG: hypothetical protein GTN65_11180, partial [Armatimonadetes bacterium]|nr:hypothetical protein [Armatimonadota bacterium]NIO97630.1 hypothetical protein [Armatimonadota bacterium]
KHLVGKCELEQGRQRAPLACLEAQRFRLLQMANNLEVTLADGKKRKLTQQERSKLVDELDIKGDLTFGRLRRLLGL